VPRKLLGRLGRGALAGAAATAPMTAVMRSIHRRLPLPERDPLPPQGLATELASRAGAPAPVQAEVHRRGWLLAHFGYGAAAGAAFAALSPRPTLAMGAGSGLALWAAGYLGWVPALEMPHGAPEETTRRNSMMIAAHLVWGAATAAICSRLAARGGARG
jgi:hypothetical protein